MEQNKKTIVYFAPHQDDELNNLGVDICRELDAGHAVYCVLCTDGSSSGVRRRLGDGEGCMLHAGRHTYPMDRKTFSAARDREFIASCRSLGLAEANIIISPLRVQDGSLSVAAATDIIVDALQTVRADDAVVKTLARITGCGQNPDHTGLAEAAARLMREGRFASLEQFYEPIYMHVPAPENADLIYLYPENAQQKKRLLNAAACYNIWDPERGYYAVGYHSVKDEFDAFIERPLNLKCNTRPTVC